MAVIIPSAGLAPALPQGTRADPRAFGALGEAMSGLGAAAFDAVDAIDRQDRAAELREARVAAAERLGALRVEYDQTADWTDLSARFERDAAAAAEEIGAALSPRSRGDFDLVWREMQAAHGVALRDREYGLRRDHERGRLASAIDGLVAQTAAAPDDSTAAGLADQTADTIAEARAAGWISAQEEARMLADAASQTASGRALGLLRDNPARLLVELEDGRFASLGPEQVERLRTSADEALNREAERELTQAEQAERERLAALRTETDAALRLLDAGLTPENLEDLRTRAAGTPYAAPVETALRARREAGALAMMPPQRQAAAIEAWRGAHRQPGDEEVYAAMLRAHAATIESVTKDLLGHVQQRDIVNVPPIDLADPAAVRARVTTAEAVAAGWGGGAPARYFTDAEVAGYAARLRDASPEDQLALAVAIVDGFGDRADAALGELGVAAPNFGHAGALIAVTGDDRAARAILAGQRLRDAKEGATPKKAVRDAVVAEIAAPATPGDDRMRARLLAAADAHFALTGQSVDPADEAAVAEAYEASIQAAAGGVIVDGQLFGGIQDVNGRAVILPPQLDERSAERLLAAAGPDALAAASLGGPPLMADGSPYAESATGLALIYDGGGGYLLGRETATGMALIADAKAPDGFYRVDLRKLIDTVRPPPTLYERASGALRRGLGGQP